MVAGFLNPAFSGPHSVDVHRPASTISAGEETLEAWVSVATGMACLLEPMPAWQQDSIFGDVSGGRFRLTWGTTPTLERGYRVTWQGRRFSVRPDMEDTARPIGSSSVPLYQTAVLEEDVIRG